MTEIEIDPSRDFDVSTARNNGCSVIVKITRFAVAGDRFVVEKGYVKGTNENAILLRQIAPSKE